MREALVPFAALIIMFTVIGVVKPRTGRPSLNSAQTHALTQSTPLINPSGNPYRMGAYVYVMEGPQPSEHDWSGTYIGMQDGYALIRDQATLVVTHVNRDQLYSAHH